MHVFRFESFDYILFCFVCRKISFHHFFMFQSVTSMMIEIYFFCKTRLSRVISNIFLLNIGSKKKEKLQHTLLLLGHFDA